MMTEEARAARVTQTGGLEDLGTAVDSLRMEMDRLDNQINELAKTLQFSFPVAESEIEDQLTMPAPRTVIEGITRFIGLLRHRVIQQDTAIRMILESIQ